MLRETVGKYRIVGLLGVGAMGEVYRAHDPLLGRDVALKTIAPALAAREAFRRRFLREAQAAAQLNHPNVVTIFDYGEEAESGLTYIAMELLEGTDLRQALRERRLARLPQRLDVMEQLADGLGFAHARGVVHRDLKPGNVHLLPHGQVKILDFGLARLGRSDITRAGVVLGTPYYMAPEQVLGLPADTGSDVFSLGTVFYEILTGRRPFEGSSMQEVLHAIVEREPQPVRQLAPEVPEAVAAVVERALEKDKARRPAHAGEVAGALATARESLAGETLPALGSEATLLAATRIGTADATQVAGSNALAPERAHAADDKGTATRGTIRGTRTVQPRPARRGRRPLLAAAAALAVVTVGALVTVLVVRSRAPQPVATPRSAPLVDELAQALVSSQLELARSDLERRQYEAAARHARAALGVDPRNATARELLARAEAASKELEREIAAARTAYARGALPQAAAALERVLALDPRSPLALELSAGLDRHFRSRAEDARRRAREARAAAESVRGSAAGLEAARRVAKDADAHFQGARYAAAAQKYAESQAGFEAVRREAEAVRSARAVTPVPPAAARAQATELPTDRAVDTRPVQLPPPTPQGAPGITQPTVAPPQPAAPPPPAPATAEVPPATPAGAGATTATSATAAPSAAARSADPRAAIQRLVDDYARAVESRDVAAFRRLMPGLSGDAERRLRAAFSGIDSQKVGIELESIDLQGERATVRLTRSDVVNGRPQKPVRQVLLLEQVAGSWRIASMRAQ